MNKKVFVPAQIDIVKLNKINIITGSPCSSDVDSQMCLTDTTQYPGDTGAKEWNED